jgi:hypothetical protein
MYVHVFFCMYSSTYMQNYLKIVTTYMHNRWTYISRSHVCLSTRFQSCICMYVAEMLHVHSVMFVCTCMSIYSILLHAPAFFLFTSLWACICMYKHVSASQAFCMRCTISLPMLMDPCMYVYVCIRTPTCLRFLYMYASASVTYLHAWPRRHEKHRYVSKTPSRGAATAGPHPRHPKACAY